MQRRCVVLFLVAACGDNLLGPPDATIVIDPADATFDAPSLPACQPAVSPAAGATNVGVFTTVVIELSTPPDPDAQFELVAPHATNPVPATITVSGCRIMIDPVLPLDSDATYRVRAPGIATSFSTVNDPWVLRTSIYTGLVASGETHVVDGQGRVLDQKAIAAVGADGIIGTADDSVWYHAAFTYQDVDAVTSIVRHYDPGPDQTAFTADDVLTGLSTWSNDPAQPYWYTLGHSRGPDGIPDTADDAIGGYTKYTYDADGTQTGMILGKDSGPDGVPFNADDTIDIYTVVTATHGFLYQDPGDQLASMTDVVRDAHGRVIQVFEHDVGPDGVIGTADDPISSASAFDYDPTTGLQSAWRASYQPGPDGIWLTDDDTYFHDDHYTYDVDGNLLQTTDYTSQHTPFDIIYYAPIVGD